MSETGWPLIPRELLPAPIKRVRHPRPPEDQPATGGRQLSIFGAETTEPAPADLAGLLAGPGHLERMGGTARVSVPVDAAWRVHVLMNELVRRGLVVSWQPITVPIARSAPVEVVATGPPAMIERRRPESLPRIDDADVEEYDVGWDDEPASAVIGGGAESGGAEGGGAEGGGGADAGGTDVGGTEAGGSEIADIPREVSDSAADGTPAESDESGETDEFGESGAIADQWHVPLPLFEVRTAYSSRLNTLARSWPEAAGGLFLSGPRLRLWVAAAGYPTADGFRLGLAADQDPAVVDAALVRAGLAGSVSDDRRSYLIMGERRLARLAELVGQRPPEAPVEAWPGGAPA